MSIKPEEIKADPKKVRLELFYTDSKVNINLYRNKFIRKGNIIER